MLLDGADLAELLGQLGEAFLLGRLREALVHVGPFEVLAVCGILEVLRRRADALKLAQPHLGVVLLVCRRFAEDLGDLLEAFLLRHRCEIGVLVRCLRLAGEGGLQILLGLRSFVLAHEKPLSL